MVLRFDTFLFCRDRGQPQCTVVQHKSGVDTEFPIAGGTPTLLVEGGSSDLRRVHFPAKMYSKMKELGPIGGEGVWSGVGGLDPTM